MRVYLEDERTVPGPGARGREAPVSEAEGADQAPDAGDGSRARVSVRREDAQGSGGLGLTTGPNVLGVLRGIRAPLITRETSLHELVADALAGAGVAFEREVRLGPRERIDFLAEGGVGIECKKGKPNGPSLLRQITRYAAHERVVSIVVVTAWERHVRVPGEILGKPATVVGLNRNWGLAI